MAILTSDQLTEIRQKVQISISPNPAATKSQINLAVQSVEDYFESTVQLGASAAIETAVPGKFTAAQKKQIVKCGLLQKYGRN